MSVRRAAGRLAASVCCALAVLALAVPGPSPLLAQTSPAGGKTLQLGRVDALALGQRAVAVGRYDLSKRVATALLQVNPRDAEAMMLLSVAEARLGNNQASIAAADSATQYSTGPRSKFEATFLKAAAHASAGQRFRAQYYLRKASDLAPDAPALAATRRSYAQLVNASPLRLSFDFSLGPSRNLNGGSLHDSINILPGLAIPLPQPLSGVSYGGAARFSYRLARDKTSVLDLTGGLRFRGAILSESSRAIAPSISNGDLAYGGIDIGLSRRWKPDQAPVAFSLSAKLAHHWYGGKSLSDQIRTEFSASRVLAKNRVLRMSASAEATRDSRDARRDADTFGIAGTYLQSFPTFGQVEVELAARRINSDAAGLAYAAQGVNLGWRPRDVADRFSLAFGLGAERRDYYLTPALPADVKLSASASVAFSKLTYMGFAPEMTFSATRIKSTFKPRDSFDYGLNLGLRSTF